MGKVKLTLYKEITLPVVVEVLVEPGAPESGVPHLGTYDPGYGPEVTVERVWIDRPVNLPRIELPEECVTDDEELMDSITEDAVDQAEDDLNYDPRDEYNAEDDF